MINTLKHNALTETYIDVEKLIYATVWKFKRKFGGDFEELVAEANFIYVLAFDSYKESRAAFTTWLCFCIWRGLQNHIRFIREKNKYTKILPLEQCPNREFVIEKPSFFFEMLDEFGEDSKTIIKLVFNPPEELKKESNHSFKVDIRIYLSTKFGWTGRRIKESFEEIGKVITSG